VLVVVVVWLTCQASPNRTHPLAVPRVTGMPAPWHATALIRRPEQIKAGGAQRSEARVPAATAPGPQNISKPQQQAPGTARAPARIGPCPGQHAPNSIAPRPSCPDNRPLLFPPSCRAGLVAQQQCCGPLQLPVADVAVFAQSHQDIKGSATAIGARSPCPALLISCSRSGGNCMQHAEDSRQHALTCARPPPLSRLQASSRSRA
jgi:hypothetical protein